MDSHNRRCARMLMAAVVIAAAPATAAAQCADGTPPPCGGGRAAPRLDRNRIAILPFRVSGADHALEFLRNGLAELLPAEFNGDVGPVAVEPGEVLSEWKRAG